jgi:predicted phosphodiesterase
MRLLHLSDIHFREPECLQPDTDVYKPIRTRLLGDVVGLCREKHVDAILVGGDIAFKAHQDEFATATIWLKDLADRTGCRQDRIYVVPGNHDVDRSVCQSSRAVANAQGAIAGASPEKMEAELRAQLRDADAGPALFKPLAAYNAFASPFAGYISPDKPFWTSNLDEVLGGGVTLRLHGLTSTLISGLGNRDEAPGRLYLSPLQTVLDPEADVLNLVMAHHPPQWFVDHEEVEDSVNNKAPLQFFGHAHRQRCTQTPSYVRFSAGALHPDRNERDYQPGYNLIDLDVIGEGQHRVVKVRAHVRQWQRNPDRFIAVQTRQSHDVWESDILFPSHATHVVNPTKNRPAAESAVPAEASPVASAEEVAMSSPSTKDLVFRFFNLDDSQKRDLLVKLALITENDLKLSGEAIYNGALRLAAQRGQLEELAHEVELLKKKS